MKIRKFKLSDAVSTARLHRNTIRAINSKDYPADVIRVWSGKTSAKKFRDSHNTCFRWIATEKGKIVGFADMSKDGEFGGLYVHKNYLGKGIGSALITKIEEKAKELGVKRLKVKATVTAKSFYEKCGYKVITKAKHQSIYRGEIVFIDVYLMVKNLDF